VDQRVDRCAHRLEIVAHDEQRAPRSHGVEQVVHAAPIGSTWDRGVLRRHEVEHASFECVECVRVRVEALDAQAAALDLGGDPGQRAL
jgi:hypothetical protein